MIKSILPRLKFLFPLMIFIGIGFFLWRGLSLDPREVPSALIGAKTPEFSVPDLKNPRKKLSNRIFQGQVSLLNVWASWCVACAEEHPVLVSIAERHAIPVYGLNYKDDRQKALDFLAAYTDPYQAVGFDALGTVAINWGVYGTPETFVIDKQGIIRARQVGPITPEIWKNKLLPLIKRLQEG